MIDSTGFTRFREPRASGSIKNGTERQTGYPMKQLVLAVILLLPAFALAADAAATDTPADHVGPENRNPPDAGLKQRLTPLQHAVTQQEDTERAFHNEYWDEKREGIYVDVVSGEPLFSSQHKSRSSTGWPSFYRALER